MASLAMEMGDEHLRRIAHFAEICARCHATGEATLYLLAAQKMLGEAREIAKLLKEIEASFVNHEKNQ